MSDRINYHRRWFLGTAAMSLAAAQLGIIGCGVQQMTRAADHLPIEGDLPSLGRANEWLNSQPLTAAGMRGKVVLIQFWTYTCINWLRTLPYARAWAEKYKDQGLVVIGVHSLSLHLKKRR
jgi:thiol-disulfide isomerase/thioredoxin